MSRVNKLYDKVKSDISNSYLGCRFQKVRSVLYQLSGHGGSFQLIPLHLPPTAKISRVAVGATHNIALTSDMLVYSWGEGKRGQLGLTPPPDCQEQPKLVDSLVSKSISAVGAGNGFSAFVTDSGMVYTCGEGTNGCLGHGDWNDISTPKLIDSLLTADIEDVSCGDNHMVLLARSGSIYICGLLPSSENVCTPQELELPKGFMASSISCGPDATGVISTEGELLVCGSNQDNRLGLDFNFFTYRRKVPLATKLSPVKCLKKWRAASVDIGKHHTAVLTDTGQVITMGSNNDNQLGHNSGRPSIVRAVVDRIVTMVKCGPTYTVIGTVDNAVYFWGTRFTQEHGISENSGVSTSTIETFLAKKPQEILVLYSSPEQVSIGLNVTLSSLHPLWHCVLVVVDTTAPHGKKKEVKKPGKKNEDDFDSLGPVPDWIQEELSKATHEWPGTFVLETSH